MKTKLLSMMCITMLFMGCDLFGPSCEDLQLELTTAADTFVASYATAMAGGDAHAASEDCDAYVTKMQEYVDKGCGDEEGGAVLTSEDVTATQAMCTLLEAMHDDE